MTDITIINVATPNEIPTKEKIVIIEKNFSFVLGRRYFKDTHISKKVTITLSFFLKIQLNFYW